MNLTIRSGEDLLISQEHNLEWQMILLEDALTRYQEASQSFTSVMEAVNALTERLDMIVEMANAN